MSIFTSLFNLHNFRVRIELTESKKELIETKKMNIMFMAGYLFLIVLGLAGKFIAWITIPGLLFCAFAIIELLRKTLIINDRLDQL